jgi:hypothetical protein
MMLCYDDCLPQYPFDDMPVDPGGSSFYPLDVDGPALTGPVVPESSFRPYNELELSRILMGFHKQSRVIETAGPTLLDRFPGCP